MVEKVKRALRPSGFVLNTPFPVAPARRGNVQGVLAMAEITREQIVEPLSNLPVIQIAELIKELENKWGVKAAPAAVAVAAGPAAAAAPVVEERTEFDVVL